MELTVARRAAEKKSATKHIRREGNIPAILYSKGEKGKEIIVDGIVFKKVLNTTPTGTLSSKVFTLNVDGQNVKAIVKDIQYQITTYNVIHIDFEQLHDEIPVTLNIPIICTHVMDCAGIKLGGVLRQTIRQLKVTCMPADIPSQFEANIRDLMIGQTFRLNQLSIPSSVKPRMNLKELVAVIAKK